jgi:hypothetical protein
LVPDTSLLQAKNRINAIFSGLCVILAGLAESVR